MWCPKCKTEYQDGIKVCADCGSQLIDSTAEEIQVANICSLKEEAMAEKFLGFLKYSNISDAKIRYNDDSKAYDVVVPLDQEKKAEKLFRGFMTVTMDEKEDGVSEPEDSSETEESASKELSGEIDEDSQEDNQNMENYPDLSNQQDLIDQQAENLVDQSLIDDDPVDLLYSPSKDYVKKADEYRDLKFSGITFLIFGILGIGYLILSKLDIIPISYNIVIFVAISVMFVSFVLTGIYSMFKSSRVKKLISEEEETTANILSWLVQTIDDETVEKWRDSNVSEEENDLLIMAHIRAVLIKKYPDTEISYLEMISEEFFDSYYGAEDTDETL